MSFNIEELVRANIKKLQPQYCAREDSNEPGVLLDANENSLGSPLMKWYNRYPDPHQRELKNAISAIKAVDVNSIFIGNGSAECIDLLYRCFCEPGTDNVIICPPTNRLYEKYEQINNVEIRNAPLLGDFQLDLVHLENLIDANTKIIWICSPNDPTGNSMERKDIESVLNNFNGLVVVDESYINFSRHRSFTNELDEYPNLVVLQTFSKAWGLAGLRLAMAFASTTLIQILNKVKPLHNISQPTQELALKALEEVGQVNDMIKEIVQMRNALKDVFEKLPFVEKVFPSDANFLLVKMKEAERVYKYLLDCGIAVHNCSDTKYCENCLRITVGTEQENTILIDALADWYVNNRNNL